ncbi:SEC-C motif-containing protein [Maribacter vaceletii]|uniref:SEC-C motif-containing protein n=1 Tax=Maribacter vaceletii TaxID=1206816 RepID=A0A495ECQ8_9FLAO|nr:YchJ family metal-binding protein [Maribacter vaceletii]RKR14670.1 SEC-C motif-containing protein [Maribacter vaceletii]
MEENCFCGNKKSYTICCKILHNNILKTETAEQLMRSRYSAFASGNGDYLMKSHHSKTRVLEDKKEIIAWAESVTWIKLEVLETTKGKKEDTEGTVTFNAHYYENGKVNILNEKSAFVKENGHWVYLGLAD